MADKKVEQLNSRLMSIAERFKGSRVNVSQLDSNITAIKHLIGRCYDSGIISVYRALNADEKQSLSRFETDDIASAYYVLLDGTAYYITYKPEVDKKKNKGSLLEHVNRSTPFVEALLSKIAAEYSFLYCKSRVNKEQIKDFGFPNCVAGYSASGGRLNKEGSLSKYELFFLIECLDSIDGAENLFNIIDSVLFDATDDSTDFFSALSYAKLEREDSTDFSDNDMPEIDPLSRKQLNTIITQIRESDTTRQQILDFLGAEKASAFYKFLKGRNTIYNLSGGVRGSLGDISCRVMPIGVFLNEIENYSLTYQITAPSGKSMAFSYNINPTQGNFKHTCPNCHNEIQGNTRVVLVEDGTLTVACTDCAEKCKHANCKNYTLKATNCAVCGKSFCRNHRKTVGAENICNDCAKVFTDTDTRVPLTPASAASPTNNINFVNNIIKSVQQSGFTLAKLANALKGIRLTNKDNCKKCHDISNNQYVYYLKADCAECADCGEFFYKPHLKMATDGSGYLCLNHRYSCDCGSVVNIKNTTKCDADGCEQRFCKFCKQVNAQALSFKNSLKVLDNASKNNTQFKFEDKSYCARHMQICKSCGKLKPYQSLKMCTMCGGYTCQQCDKNDKLCPACLDAGKVNNSNYKLISVKKRLTRLNDIGIFKKLFGKYAVQEDFLNVVYSHVNKEGIVERIVYNKITNEFSEIKKG